MRVEAALARAARLYPHATAVEDAERAWSYRELAAAAARVEARLRGLQLGPGDRVALIGGNRGAWLAAWLGASAAGVVVVALNTRLASPELEALIADAAPALVVVDAQRAWGDAGGGPARVTLESLLDEAWSPPAAARSPLRSPEGDAVILYTSGTTGRPKGVRLTHTNLLAGHVAWRATLPLAPGEAVLQVTPPWHAGAVITLLGVVAQGGTAVLRETFLPPEIVRLLATRPIVCALMVPAMLRWVLQEPGVQGAAFPHLRLLVYAGAPMPQDLLAEARAVFGCGFAQGYGLTESTAVLTLLTPQDHEDLSRLGTVGREVLGAWVRVVDEAGEDCAPGVIGEVVATGDMITPGYWRQPDARGPLRTGDLGRLEEGWLTLVGRKKELILVGGENVHPREVEAVLEGLPGVVEVAVLGLPHAVFGEELVALVVPAEPGADKRFTRGLQQACRAQLARYKVPSRVRLAGALPRTATAKVERTALRAAWDAATEPP